MVKKQMIGIAPLSAKVFEASVFRCITNGTYFTVETVRHQKYDGTGSEVVIRRAPTGAKRTVSLFNFLRDYVWVGPKSIVAQLQTS